MGVIVFIILLSVFIFWAYKILSDKPHYSAKPESTPKADPALSQNEAVDKMQALKMIARSENSEYTDELIEYSIVGESKYQEQLSEICGGYLKSKEARTEEATIIAEPDNPIDRNAVAIKVKEKVVGYIPRTDTRYFLELLKGKSDGLTCPAEIRGGWKRRDGTRASYGVFLQIKVASEYEL